MANLYTPYDGGLFESTFQSGLFLKNRPTILVAPSVGVFTMDNEYVIQGINSAKLTITGDADPAAASGVAGVGNVKGVIPNFYFRQPPGSVFQNSYNIISLAPGRYKLTLDIITPAGNPVADDNALIGIGNWTALLQTTGGSWTNNGDGSFTFTHTTANQKWLLWKVSAIKDTLKVLEYIWDDPGVNSGLIYQFPGLIIALNNPTGLSIPIASVQNLLVGGKLFFDVAYLDLATPPCSIAFSSPAYDKTDETVALHDGTITVHATGQGALQYKLDGGAFQFSNLFTGIDPGNHTITVKDASACGNITTPVTILEFDAPDPPPPPPAGPLTMDEKPVNSYNFVSWFSVVGLLGFEGGVNCINEFWDLPRSYRLDAFTKNHYAAVMQGEDFSFYINFDQAITYPSFSNLKVALCNSGGVIKADCGQLFKDANPDNSYNIYATLNLDASIPEGKYFLLIYDVATNATLYMSSGLQVMTEANAKSLTVRCINRNTYDIYKYYYSRVPNYVNQIRLQMNLVDEESEATIVNYRAVSNGRLRNVSIELDKWIQLETYYFDDNAIRGMYVFQICDTININEKDYIIKDIYKTTWNPKRCVNKGLVSFYEQQFSTANRFGIPGNLTIVGSDDPLLLGDNGGFIKL